MKAFSLVELIVVVGIVMILTGIGAAAINSFIQVKKLESATAELSTQIKLARNMAITSQLPNGSGGGFNFVKITIYPDFRIYARAVKMVGVGTSTIGDYFNKKIDSTNGLVLVSPQVDFGFSAASGRLVNVATGEFIDPSVKVILGVNGDDDTKPITINNLGLIDD
jgi:Tfp pilus assembly protein FimT